MVPPDSDKVSRAPSYSGYFQAFQNFGYETFTLFGATSQMLLLSIKVPYEVLQPRSVNWPVWAIPRSLAATGGISVDFYSCRYLDVSVPCVRLEMATLLTIP